MARKSYIIIGVGRFGLSIVKTLAHTDVEVMVVDKDPEKLKPVADYVTETVCADASDADVLRNLGVKNFDGALVTLGSNLEDRVLITMQLKDLEVPFVMVKARSELDGRILTKVGADKVVYPEREMGIHIGNQIARGNLFSSIELTENYSIDDFSLPRTWIGKTIRDINVRAKYGISIIGIRGTGKLEVNPQPDYVLTDKDTLVILGSNEHIASLRKKTAEK